MKRYLDLMVRAFAIVGLVAVSATVLSSAAMAQQKTAKQCRDEWRADEAANKAKGVTESAYVKDCRAGTTTAAQPTATPAAAPAATPAASGQKTAKQCRDEWRANEAANKAKGVTESAYVKNCRAGTTTRRSPRRHRRSFLPLLRPAGTRRRRRPKPPSNAATSGAPMRMPTRRPASPKAPS